MLRVLVSVSLLEEQQEGTLPSAAAAARAAVDAGMDPNLEGAPLRAMAAASDRIARLIALAPRLRALTARAAAIAASAALLSSKDTAERQLVLSRRFSPLAGGQLFNFSGFLDRPLRDLDFYIGVYDALQQIAVRNCQVQGPYVFADRPAPVFRADAPLELDLSAPDTQRCLGKSLSAVFGEMRLSHSPRTSFVVARLAQLEVTASMGGSAAAAPILAEPSWSWLGDPQLPSGDQLGAALSAVTSRKAPCKHGDGESLCLADPSFDELLDGLQHSGYVAMSSEMRDALSDRDRWTAKLAGRLVDRAAAVESVAVERTRGPVSGTFLTGVGLGQLWARRTNSLSGRGLDLDPSSIPSRSPAGARPGLLVAAHVLPYRVSLDVVRGGIAFSWVEPSLRLLPSFSIDSVADLLSVEGSGRVATKLGLIPTLRGLGAAFGAGAQVVLPWNGDSVALPGIVGRIAWLQERLALTGGVRSLSSGQRESFVTLSVSDINGLAYWLALWAVDWK
jgi:hypothetical protein